MLCLMKNEKACLKLKYEIDDAVRAGKVPTGLEEVVSDSQARQLPYLQAVIKEVCGFSTLGNGVRLIVES